MSSVLINFPLRSREQKTQPILDVTQARVYSNSATSLIDEGELILQAFTITQFQL